MVQKQEFYRQTIQEAAASLHTDPKRGLSAQEAERRLWENGENRLPEAEKKSVLQSFLEQLNDPLIYVLLAAALISVLLGEYSDAGIIAFVVCLNAAVGVLQEGKAQRALDSLKQLMQPRAVVIRDGSEQEIPAAKLVVGDLVCLQAGAMVPADLRLVEAENLQLQEAALTGENLPVQKQTARLSGKQGGRIPLGDRNNMTFLSTMVSAGRGTGMVCAVGLQTQIGKIAALMHESREETTPLQKKLGELGKFLSLGSLGICIVLFLLAIVQKRPVDSLKQLMQPRAVVIRDGSEQEIPAAKLVVGDLVCLQAGAMVPADLRLVEAENLQLQEAALTGENLPVQKQTARLSGKQGGRIPLGDRNNMTFLSTMVSAGRGTGMVCAVGLQTQIGKIAALMHESREETTPLQKKLGELGKFLSLGSLGICIVLFLLAIVQKRPVFDMLLTAISLAVAAVPEGLPAVVTLCLALSVTRMAKINTIIRRLPSVETLGAVSVVCSDKTGTLTQNKMTVEACFADQKLLPAERMNGKRNRDLFLAMLLCNDAQIKKSRVGDPTELALLDFGARYGFEKNALGTSFERKKENAFDSDRKMMSVLCREQGKLTWYVKGAADRILKRCSQLMVWGQPVPMTQAHRQQILAGVEKMAAEELRTLAFACRPYQEGEPENMAETNLIFLGITGMRDPIRPEAIRAVADFQKAGVSTVMITGDHVATAFAVGKKLGIVSKQSQCMTGEVLSGLSEDDLAGYLDEIRVFARVSPKDKVKIVRAFQKRGQIVAMTGDGVNDAPSLKAADVGIAMGKGGTDVARQASDMILTDDNFATIRRAMEEGRGVYENIRKSVLFLLSSNLGEILTMFAAVLMGLPSPLQSAHILWINLITDSLPALALGVDKNDGKKLMGRPPRTASESLLANGGLSVICFYGALIAGISLTAFFTVPYMLMKQERADFSVAVLAAFLEQKKVLKRAQTYAFTVLGMSQLFHAVGMRDVRQSIFSRRPFENRLMLVAGGIGFLLQAAVTELPFLTGVFETLRLSVGEWLYLAGLSCFPLLAHELFVLLEKNGTQKLMEKFGRDAYESDRDQERAA